MGHEDAFPRLRLSARCRFGQATFSGTHGNERDAPIAAVCRTSGTEGAGRQRSFGGATVIVPIDNLWWPVSIPVCALFRAL